MYRYLRDSWNVKLFELVYCDSVEISLFQHGHAFDILGDNTERAFRIGAESEIEVNIRAELKERIDIRRGNHFDFLTVADDDRQDRRVEFGGSAAQVETGIE